MVYPLLVYSPFIAIVIDCVSEYDQNVGQTNHCHHCSISTTRTLWFLDDFFSLKNLDPINFFPLALVKTLLVFDSNRDKFEQFLPEIVVVREIVS